MDRERYLPSRHRSSRTGEYDDASLELGGRLPGRQPHGGAERRSGGDGAAGRTGGHGGRARCRRSPARSQHSVDHRSLGCRVHRPDASSRCTGTASHGRRWWPRCRRTRERPPSRRSHDLRATTCGPWATTGVDDEAHALLEHWDGDAWTIVLALRRIVGIVSRPCRASAPAHRTMSGRSAITTQAARIIHPLIEHWDGVSWTQVTEPRPPRVRGRQPERGHSGIGHRGMGCRAQLCREDDRDDTLIAPVERRRWSRSAGPGQTWHLHRNERSRRVGQQRLGRRSELTMRSHCSPTGTGLEWVRDAAAGQAEPRDRGPVGRQREPDQSDAWVAGYAPRQGRLAATPHLALGWQSLVGCSCVRGVPGVEGWTTSGR